MDDYNVWISPYYNHQLQHYVGNLTVNHKIRNSYMHSENHQRILNS